MLFFKNSGFGLISQGTLSRLSRGAYLLVPVGPARDPSLSSWEVMLTFLLNGVIWSLALSSLIYAIKFVHPRRASQQD